MDYQVLHLLFRFSKEFSHDRIHAADINDTECMICSYVYSNPGCSQDDVSNTLKVDKTTIAKALAALETKGHVQRSQNPGDRRKKQLVVTEKGRESISNLFNLHNEWLSSIMTCLSEQEQADFESYCARLLNAAESLAHEQKSKSFRFTK